MDDWILTQKTRKMQQDLLQGPRRTQKLQTPGISEGEGTGGAGKKTGSKSIEEAYLPPNSKDAQKHLPLTPKGK